VASTLDSIVIVFSLLACHHCFR